MRFPLVLVVVLVVAACAGAGGEGSTSPPPSVRTAIEEYLNELGKADEFSGVVLVAKDFVPFAGTAMGYSDRSQGTPISLATPLNIASVAKLFTAVAVGRLVDQGKVDLDDPLSKHLPAHGTAAGDRVTIAMLLAHTAATGDYLSDPGYLDVRDRFANLDELLAAIDTTVRPGGATGEAFESSNLGYLLLGSVVEKASGRDYYEYVADEVFPRAGVAGGFHRNTEDDRRRLGYALGYREDGSTNWSVLPVRGTPAGGAYATAGDLLSFHKALSTGALVRPETRGRLAVRPPAAGRASSGLTSGVFAGSDVGASAVFAMTSGGYTVVVLANEGEMAEPVADRVLRVVEPPR